MARPKSDEKRNAILAAAIQIFAERGLAAAPTSAISSLAGVAEGTLFTYFKTKDELLNALYREIKLELADAMMSGFPRKKSVRSRLQHVWHAFVNWGVANPAHRMVLAQLEASDRLTRESKKAGAAPFEEIQTMAKDAIAQHLFQDLPQEFIATAMRSLAEGTMDFIVSSPKNAKKHSQAGFEIFWAGVRKKR